MTDKELEKRKAVEIAVKTLAAYNIHPFQRFSELPRGTHFHWVLTRDGGERQCQVVEVHGGGKVWSYVDDPCECFQDTGNSLVYRVVRP